VLTAVRGSTASAAQLWRIQIVGAALMTAMLASLGPILLFFTLSTESHGFMVVLNTVFFAIAGALGLRAIWIRCRAALQSESARDSMGLLRAWLVIAVLVGMQSAWILRPLIGRPNDSFTVVEPRGSNAFAGFLSVFEELDR